MGEGGNGDEPGRLRATCAGLQSILIRARLAEAKEEQDKHTEVRASIERARQARVRAQRRYRR